MKKKVIRIVIVVAVILLILAGAAYFTLNHYTSKLNYQTAAGNDGATYTPENTVGLDAGSTEELDSIDAQLRDNLASGADWDFDNKNVTNILLVGVDNDYSMEARGNADGLIILSINKETKQIVLTSLMRDLYVSVPDKYNTKLTLVYHYEGLECLMDTIEANFGVPIDNYALVNYLNLIEIVDSMGGITLDVSGAEIYGMQEKIENLTMLTGAELSDNMLSQSQAGEICMNGIQTVAYLRIRNTGDNDFGRTERARNVIIQMKNQATNMSLKDLNKFANVVLPCVTTDLTKGEILSLLLNVPDFLKYDFVSSRIPLDDTFYFADFYGSVVVPDYFLNKEYLYNTIYEGVS